MRTQFSFNLAQICVLPPCLLNLPTCIIQGDVSEASEVNRHVDQELRRGYVNEHLGARAVVHLDFHVTRVLDVVGDVNDLRECRYITIQ